MTNLYLEKSIGLFLCILMSTVLPAQNIRLVQDINAATSSSPYNSINSHPEFAVAGNYCYFTANDGIHGGELWRTDGTTAGTKLVKDIYPGSNGSYCGNITAAGTNIIFSANDGVHGSEPWISDGTAAGTHLLKDCTPGAANTYPSNFTKVDNQVFFAANPRNYSYDKLWVTDGTEAGTIQVEDFYTPAYNYSYSLGALTAFNHKLYFTIYNNNDGSTIYQSNGTTAGTIALQNNGYTNPYNLLVYKGYLYFTGISTVYNNSSLFRTDGVTTTLASTNHDYIISPTYNFSPALVPFKDDIYFSGASGNGNELFKFNTISRTATAVSDINPGVGNANPVQITAASDQVFFAASSNGTSTELWVTDGNPANTTRLKVLDSVNLRYGAWHAFQNSLVFTYISATTGSEAWISDGTPAGTKLIKDINPGIYSATSQGFTTFRNTNLFSANDGMHGYELWKSDGTDANTKLLKDINTSASESAYPAINDKFHIATADNKMLFLAQDNQYGAEPWITDGTTASLVKDLAPGWDPGITSPYFTRFNNSQYFLGVTPYYTPALWRTDGTTAGTVHLQDLFNPVNPTYQMYAFDLAASGNKLFLFVGSNTDELAQLYTTNGTTPFALAKTKMFRWGDYFPVAIGNTLYFAGADGVNGSDEVWKSNGTVAGTSKVKDIVPGDAGSDPSNLIVFNSKLFFRATPNGTDYYLWRSNGTSDGTKILKTGIQAGISSFAISGGWLYFAGDNGTTGEELWKTDGTTVGTTLVKDILLGSYGSAIGQLTDVKGTLYFSAYDGVHGFELWKSDGTRTGTQLVKDITPGSGGTIFSSMAAGADGRLYFVVNDTLWRSDGTAANTQPVVDNNLAGLIYISQLTTIGNLIYFTASANNYGNELYAIHTDSASVTKSSLTVSKVATAAPSLAVNPNPAKNIAFIHSTVAIPNASLSVVDTRGAVLINSKLNINAGETRLDVSRLIAGVYFLSIQSPDGKLERCKLLIGR